MRARSNDRPLFPQTPFPGLEQKVDSVTEEKKEETNALVQDLRGKLDDLRTKAGEIQDTGGDAWHDVAAGFNTAWTDVTTAVARAKSKF